MKRILAFVLAALLLMGCAACASPAKPNDAQTSNTAEEKKTSEKTSEKSSEKESGQEKKEETALYYNETGYPICNEPITLTMMCVANGSMDLNDRMMVEIMEEKFGIRLDVTGYSSGEDFITQLNLAMTTGDLPDLIAPSGKMAMNQMQQYTKDGYVLALNEYKDLMPNLYGFFEEYPAYEKFLTAADGNIYALTKLEVNKFGLVDRVFINNIWLDNVGMKYPQTLDELYEVLKAFKEQDANGNGDPNDEIPFDYIAGNYYDDHILLSAFGLLTDDANYILKDDGKGNVVFGNTTEEYKAYLKYMKKLYTEGLINPECYVITNNERKAHIAENTSGFFAASAPFAWGGFGKDYDANFSYVNGLTSQYNSEKTVSLANIVSDQVRIFANADTEYPEAVARFLDYWYTLEGEIAFQRGWEGLTMEYTHDDILQGDIANLYCPEGFASTNEFKDNKALIVGPFELRSCGNGTAYRLINDASDEVVFGEQAVNANGWPVLVERRLRDDGIVLEYIFPALNYTTEQEADRASLYNDLTTYIAAQRAAFITDPAMDIDAEWDAYVAQLNSMGLPRILAIEQSAYDRYNGK